MATSTPKKRSRPLRGPIVLARKQAFVPQAKVAAKLTQIGHGDICAPLNVHDDMKIVQPALEADLGEGLMGIRVKPARKGARLPLFQQAFNNYNGHCTCGTSYDNNCAHYLSDAFARAGATFPSGAAKCPHGRMIRAKEMLAWVRTFSSGYSTGHSTLTSGYWFVYQEYNGQGHVCLHLEASDKYWWRGTGDYPSWPIQWHYFA